MKKKWIIFTILCSILLVGCFGKTSYKEVNYSKYKSMVENKESFILFIGAESCSACAIYKGSLDKVIEKYGVTVYYIDVDGLSADERKELKNTYNYEGTPTTIFITEGVEKSSYNRINGSQEYSKIVSKFKENGYIKGE